MPKNLLFFIKKLEYFQGLYPRTPLFPADEDFTPTFSFRTLRAVPKKALIKIFF